MDLAGILRFKSQIHSLQMRLALRKIGFALKFQEDQPRVPAGRPEGGQWTGAGETEFPVSLRETATVQDRKPAQLSFNSKADCDEQYERDIFQCRMVGMRSYYAQAMVRLVACERGHPVPPLNY